jgi:hypothetical protein
MNKCRCGECNMEVSEGKVWFPGHDLRALMRVVKEKYGSVEAFLDDVEQREAAV